MPFKMLLTSRTLSRGLVFSAVAFLLLFKFGLRRPAAEAASSSPLAPAAVLLGPSHLPFLPCWLEGSREQVLCGFYSVYENRQSKTGRRITLRIAVLPALKSHAAPDALFVLAGGPGQAATGLGPIVDVALKKIHQDHDIVLLDQRGTGNSNPLNCQVSVDALPFSPVHQSFAESADACLRKLDADPRFYSTFDFAGDLDDVRQALGYPQIDIWGGSYGTRAALAFMRIYPGRVRTAVLDGVDPYSNKIPLYEARDAQSALDKIFTICDHDEKCHAEFPDVRENLASVLSRLEKAPVHVTIRNPHTGVPTDIFVDRRNFATALRALLYIPSFDHMVPLVIHDANNGNFEPLVAVTQTITQYANQDVSRGLMLSVLCSEDVARVRPDEQGEATRGTFLGDVMIKSFSDGCSHWPRTFLPTGFDIPVDVPVPTLMLSGELDPVTPPVWAKQAALHFPNSIQVVVPGAGHGVSTYGCLPDLIARFVGSGSTSTLDTSCAEKGLRSPFVTSPTGIAP